MEQNQETSPQPRPLEMDPVLDSTPAVPAIEQDPKMLPLQPGPGAIPSIKPTTKPKAPATRANWVNTLWADVSGQLRRFSVISSDLFDGLLLKKNTYVGSLICTEMVSLAFSPRLPFEPTSDAGADADAVFAAYEI